MWKTFLFQAIQFSTVVVVVAIMIIIIVVPKGLEKGLIRDMEKNWDLSTGLDQLEYWEESLRPEVSYCYSDFRKDNRVNVGYVVTETKWLIT